MPNKLIDALIIGLDRIVNHLIIVFVVDIVYIFIIIFYFCCSGAKAPLVARCVLCNFHRWIEYEGMITYMHEKN